MMRCVMSLALIAAYASLTYPTAAATPDFDERKVLTGFRALDRPTGIAEAGFGWLTLPGADVCSSTTCKAGDTSFELDGWQLYRRNLRLAFGAGFLLGLIPTTDVPASDT